MKLSWMFGDSLGAHHLLYAYLAVWVIQGGYCAWIAWQWRRSGRDSRAGLPPSPESRESS